MTETEWLACERSGEMVVYLRDTGATTGRKLSLFACACCRRVWHLLAEERARQALEMLEQYVDGRATERDLHRARKAVESIALKAKAPHHREYYAVVMAMDGPRAAFWAAHRAAEADETMEIPDTYREQAHLLRDIVGNPLRPTPLLDPAWHSWNGGAVKKLAQSIYEGRAFDRLPELADLLQQAGCSDAELLGHLRGPELHARGCWAVDLLLAKA